MASPSSSSLSSASEEEQSCAAQHGELIVNSWSLEDEVVNGDPNHPLLALRTLLNDQTMYELGYMDVTEPQEADTIMDDLIVSLDTLFFQGALLAVRFEWSNVLGNGVAGLCQWDSAGDIVISVNPSPASAPAGEQRAWSILGTLLHECCHAVFDHHCCSRPPHRCHDNDCADSIGGTGHGPAWEDLAREVEARARRIIGDRVDLHIATALSLEQAYQTNTLSQQQAQALGLRS